MIWKTSHGFRTLLVMCFILIGSCITVAGTITIDKSTVGPFQAEVGQTHEQGYYIYGSGFNEGDTIMIELLNDSGGSFSISAGANYSTMLILIASTDGFINQPIAIRYTPTSEGPHSATIDHSADNTTTQTFTVDGNTTTLPIELSAFTGEALKDKIILDWATVTEKGNACFVVEVMKDLSKGFEPIGKVKSSMANSTEIVRYSFAYPLNGATGTWYFRLKQVDLDGNYALTKVISVRLPEAEGLRINIEGNLAATASTLSISAAKSGKLNIVILNMNGREVYNNSYHINSGENRIGMDLAVPPGLYILTAVSNGVMRSVKINHGVSTF